MADKTVGGAKHWSTQVHWPSIEQHWHSGSVNWLRINILQERTLKHDKDFEVAECGVKSTMTKFTNLLSIGALVSSLFAASSVFADQDEAVAALLSVDGKKIGTVTMHDGNAGVLMIVEIEDMAPGGHAIHIHKTGSCEPDFKASHGHINLQESQHGLLNPEGPDNGDLPNIYVAADGTAIAEILAIGVAVSGDKAEMRGAAHLFDEDGSAIVIHENSDDHMTQPIGGAGGRIACGVIERN